MCALGFDIEYVLSDDNLANQRTKNKNPVFLGPYVFDTVVLATMSVRLSWEHLNENNSQNRVQLWPNISLPLIGFISLPSPQTQGAL